MTVAVEQEKEMADYGPEESKINPSDYDCQILLEKTTHEAANDKSFPTDARLIWYIADGVKYMDLTRCNKVSKMFDENGNVLPDEILAVRFENGYDELDEADED